MASSRSPSRSRPRSASRSPPRSAVSPSPPSRRRRHDSQSLSPSRSRSRSISRSRSPSRSRSRSYTPPRRNGRHRSSSRDRSRDRGRDSRSLSASPPRYTKIVVERLSKNVNEDHLFEIFGQFGPIYDLDLPLNRTFGTNRGTAYILYDHHADAEAAIAHMHEAQIDGSTINVSVSTQRSKLSPEPRMARRNANMNAHRAPLPGSRGGGPPSGPQRGGGRRYGPRSDVYRPNPLSPGRSRSPRGAPPPSRGGAGGRYRSRSPGSYSSRSRSRSPLPRRRGGGNGAGRYDDYDSRRRSRSLSRSRSRSRSLSYGSERSDSRIRGRNHR